MLVSSYSKRKNRTWGTAQVVEHLPGTHEDQGYMERPSLKKNGVEGKLEMFKKFFAFVHLNFPFFPCEFTLEIM
jgi:hypothetical protein